MNVYVVLRDNTGIEDGDLSIAAIKGTREAAEAYCAGDKALRVEEWEVEN